MFFFFWRRRSIACQVHNVPTFDKNLIYSMILSKILKIFKKNIKNFLKKLKIFKKSLEKVENAEKIRKK